MDWLRQHPMAAVVMTVIAIVVIGKLVGGGDKSTAAAPEAHAAIVVDTTDTKCRVTGIDDPWTGNGHVTFYVRLDNIGEAAGSGNVTPIRYYSDGTVNKSPMDMMTSDEISVGGTTWFRSPAFEYKAHSHRIDSCAVDVDGTVTPIRMMR